MRLQPTDYDVVATPPAMNASREVKANHAHMPAMLFATSLNRASCRIDCAKSRIWFLNSRDRIDYRRKRR